PECEQLDLTGGVDDGKVGVRRLHLLLDVGELAGYQVVREYQGPVRPQRVFDHDLLEVYHGPDVHVRIVRERQDPGVEVDGDGVLRFLPVPAHQRGGQQRLARTRRASHEYYVHPTRGRVPPTYNAEHPAGDAGPSRSGSPRLVFSISSA